jgi:hypothetical protein
MKVIFSQRVAEAEFDPSHIFGIIVKMCNILSKRSGMRLMPSPVPIAFESNGKSYEGIEVYIAGHPAKKIRFNILKGDVANIASISYWEHGLSKPTYEIDLQGFSITQVVDEVADVLTGEWFKYAKESVKHESAGNAEQRVAAFFTSDPRIIADLTRTKNVDATFVKFQRWCRQNNEREINASGFRYWANKYLRSTDLPASRSVPAVSVRNAPDEDYVEDAPDEAALFMNGIVNNAMVHKFELLETAIKQICDPMSGVNGAFIYGTGGSGKTRTIMDLIKENGAWERTIFRTGAIQGFTGLVTLLFKNRRGKLVVLDDNDDILDNKKAINILKGALNMDNPRQITYTQSEIKKPATATRRGRGAHAASSGDAEEESVKREAIDLNQIGIDFDNDAGIAQAEMIDDFIFTSKMIFISNLTKMPQPLQDRCFEVEMNFSKDDMLKLIRMRMNALFKDVASCTAEDKEYVYDFMMTFKGHIKNLTFRTFKKLVSIYLGVGRNEEQFKNQAAMMIRSEVNR